MVVAVGARRTAPKAVGGVRPVSVDWQPKPRAPNPGCLVPPGARTLASSSGALVIADGPPASDPDVIAAVRSYMGCLRADGRQRLLERLGPGNLDNAYSVSSALVAAPYAALLRDWVPLRRQEHDGPGVRPADRGAAEEARRQDGDGVRGLQRWRLPKSTDDRAGCAGQRRGFGGTYRGGRSGRHVFDSDRPRVLSGGIAVRSGRMVSAMF